MNKSSFLLLLILCSNSFSKAQSSFIETGLGIKYDVFKIKQTDQVFEQNIDLGVLAFISYARPINKKLRWEAGFATNNYKVNFRIKGPNNIIYSNRELVAVMRSNRLFFNIQHITKQLTPKLSWVNTIGVSIIVGAKNPYDVILTRSKEIKTVTGTEDVAITIQTFGKTGGGILIGAGTKLYYQLNKDFNLVSNLGFVTSMGELTKVDVNYVFGSSTSYKKAIFTSNGFTPFFTFGFQYEWRKDK